VTTRHLFRKPYRRITLTGIAVGMYNQMTGIAIVMIYSSEIFRMAGFTNASAILQTVMVGATNLLFTLLAMSVIDKVGRKPLLLAGSMAMTVFLFLFALVFLLDIRGFMPLVFMISFVACFAFSQGAVVWILFAEMFPNHLRARGASIGSFSHWVFYAILLFMFPVIQGSLGHSRGVGYVFISFAVITFTSFFFFRKYIFETKGISLEDLGK
jgi:MFS family permease